MVTVTGALQLSLTLVTAAIEAAGISEIQANGPSAGSGSAVGAILSLTVIV